MPDAIIDQVQTSQIVRQLKSLTKIPLLVAIDEEGGAVTRIPWDTMLGPAEWAQKDDGEITRVGYSRGKMLQELGINFNFAPSVDLRNKRLNTAIAGRTIDSDPNIVVEKAKAYLKGQESAGVLGLIKYFPGHGATPFDSQKTYSIINKTKSSWFETDAIPYTAVGAKAVMVGHLQYNVLDNKLPASLSRKVVNGVLRGELGFEGMVISDDMGALHRLTSVSVADALQSAISAGVDMIWYIQAPVSAREIHSQLVKLIQDEIIPKSEVDVAVSRVLKFKQYLPR